MFTIIMLISGQEHGISRWKIIFTSHDLLGARKYLAYLLQTDEPGVYCIQFTETHGSGVVLDRLTIYDKSEMVAFGVDTDPMTAL